VPAPLRAVAREHDESNGDPWWGVEASAVGLIQVGDEKLEADDVPYACPCGFRVLPL